LNKKEEEVKKVISANDAKDTKVTAALSESLIKNTRI
jgi:hypothetical protein